MANNPEGGDFKKITTYKFVQEKLEEDAAKRTEQIDRIVKQAKNLKSYAYIGYPFEAKNAPFKMRAAAVKETEIA